MKLNPAQKKAVEYDLGPLLVVAGAGTGKTTILTEKITYLIQQKNIPHQSIFAATFTQKSAEDMLARLDLILPLGYRTPWVGTFHSLADRILREEALEIGLDPNFRLITQTEQWLFIKDHLFEFGLEYYLPLGNPSKFISALITFFSRIQDELVPSQNLIEYARTLHTTEEADLLEAKKIQELAEAYQKYQQLKTEHSIMDFGDLINRTIELFSNRPNILKKYQHQFTHILIDEFQDTNYSQYQLIKLLAPAEQNPQLTVVGDDDQSIYKFRGASIANILEFKKDYPTAQEIVTSINYRSTQPLLDASYSLITKNNPDRLEVKLDLNKRLTSARTISTTPSLHSFIFVNDEVSWTINTIKDVISKNIYAYKDFAILTRANSQLEPYLEALELSQLPFQQVTNRGLYDKPEIQSLIQWLKVIADPEDNLALFNFLKTYQPLISQEKILSLIHQAQLNQQSYWQAIQHSTNPLFSEPINTIFKYQELSRDKKITELLMEHLLSTQQFQNLIKEDSIENQLKIKNINLFLERIRQFERITPQVGLIEFLKAFADWQDAGENPGQAQIEDVDTIRLMTVHSAKGLEFPIVFVGSLVAGRFPSIKRKDPIELPSAVILQPGPGGDYHLAEERRLMYVAMTRAKDQLFMTFAQNYQGKKNWHMSGFLEETGLPIHTQKDPSSSNTPLLPSSPKSIEKVTNKAEFTITSLSYSKLDTFKVCPLKFKYRYLLSIPAKPHHTLSFGRTIHETLQTFHQYQMHGKTMSLDMLLNVYTTKFIHGGYVSVEHQQKRFESGKIALTQYYHQYETLFAKPVMLEQSFSLKFGPVRFTGKIDRIDQDTQGNFQLIDYKTGNLKTQKQVDKDEQLTVYGIAAQKSLGIKPTDLSLYFIEAGEKITTRRTHQELEQAYKKLEKNINSLLESDFPAKPDPVTCGFCEYYDICPFRSKKKA